MSPDPIRQVALWPGALRLAHWLLAAGVWFELGSAWALAQQPLDPGFWHDWHVMIGQLLVPVLLLRVVLLARPGPTHWRALLPGRSQWPAIRQTLLFYITLARAPLPAWYAHNPLWAPVYLLVLLALALAVVTGFDHAGNWTGGSWQAATLHRLTATWLSGFCVLHVVAAALHDWQGDGALISALFSGKRYFHIAPRDASADPARAGSVVPFTLPGKRAAPPHQPHDD